MARVQTDRYGWILSPCHLIAPRDRQTREEESRVEQRREIKWVNMLRRWDLYSGRKRRVLERRVRKGIPDSVRGRVWKLILDSDSRFATERPSIQTLIQHDRKSCCDMIECDLKRTLPRVPVFHTSNHLDSLRHILHAYSNIDESLPYTQGMAFAAAMLLLYMDETSAFWCFYQLMSAPRFDMRSLFLSGLPKVRELNRVWSLMLDDFFPQISAKFTKEGVEPILYTASWWLAAFINLPFPSDLTLHIYDRFITFGCKALLSFGLTIIALHHDYFASNEGDVAIQLLQKPSDSPLMADWRNVIKKWDNHWISEKEYRDYLKRSETLNSVPDLK